MRIGMRIVMAGMSIAVNVGLRIGIGIGVSVGVSMIISIDVAIIKIQCCKSSLYRISLIISMLEKDSLFTWSMMWLSSLCTTTAAVLWSDLFSA